MTYFTKNFSTEIFLPNGEVASSVKDIDRYLKSAGLAAQSDYSAAYLQNIRHNKQRKQGRAIFAELVNNYKKGIWNE